MTFHWKTKDLVEAFKNLPGVGYVKTYRPGGDHDTTNIVVGHDKEGDLIHVAGYPSTEDCCTTPDDAFCEWIEITDGLDSRGGLNSTDPDTIMVYAQLRQYFANHRVSVINHYDEIF